MRPCNAFSRGYCLVFDAERESKGLLLDPDDHEACGCYDRDKFDDEHRPSLNDYHFDWCDAYLPDMIELYDERD